MTNLTDHFRAAIQRIVSGSPEHPENVELARRGRLQVNFSSVAKEAGNRSRTSISKKDCAYPHIRDEIIALQAEIQERLTEAAPASTSETPTTQDTLLALRKLKLAAESDRAIIATRLAEADIAIQLLRTENERLNRELRSIKTGG